MNIQTESVNAFANPLTEAAIPFSELEFMSPVPLGMKALFDEPVKASTEYPAPRDAPLTYPGNRPEVSYTNGENGEVWPISAHTDPETGGLRFYIKTPFGVCDLDDALEGANAPKMGDRVPVVTFGSNANPGQLLNKFRNIDASEEKVVVPTTKATLSNATPVYVPKIGMFNYSFADLYPEHGVETEVFVNWLSPAQLTAMHQTEKPYDFCEFGKVDIDGTDTSIPAYLYAGTLNAYLGEDGLPVRLKNVTTRGSKLRCLDQQEIQEELVDLTGEYIKETFEHVGESHNEIRLTVEGLHAIIKDMINHVDEQGLKLKKVDVGNAMALYLAQKGRTGEVSLLSVIPEQNRNIVPMTLSEIDSNK